MNEVERHLAEERRKNATLGKQEREFETVNGVLAAPSVHYIPSAREWQRSGGEGVLPGKK